MSAAAPSPAARPRRRWLRRIGAGGAIAAMLVVALLFWLLATVGGRDTLLARIVGMLPPGATLTWERADGVLHGPLELHGVRYRQPDGLEFRAERLLLDPDLLPVLGRRLQLDRLEVDAATLQLPPAADEPFELPTWPGSLPTLPMPIDVRSTTLAVAGLRVQRDDAVLIDISRLEARGVHLVDDGFVLDTATLASDRGELLLRGNYRPAADYASDLEATLRLPSARAGRPASLRLQARGDLDALTVAVSGDAPQPLRLDVVLRDGSGDAPAWTLRAESAGLDPALFVAADAAADAEGAAAEAAVTDVDEASADPWRFTLDAHGTGGHAQLSGTLAQGDWQVVVEPSRLSLQDGRLHAEPLALTLPQGPLQLVGDLQVEGEDAAFDVRLASPGLQLPPADTAGAAPVTLAGDARVAGTVAAWTLAGTATAQRADAVATLQVQGRGDRTQLQVDTLHADTPTGTLDGHGLWRWSPAPAFALDARLDGFDPGYFLADFAGALAGTLTVSGERDAAGAWSGRGELADLGGQLRGRAVAGHARAEWDGRDGRGDIDLRLGDSVLRADGRFGSQYDLRIDAAPLRLDDLLPAARGEVAGHVLARGPATAVDLDVDLRGGGLAWREYRAGRLDVAGTLPAARTGGRFELQAADLDVGGVALERLALTGAGSRRQLRLQGDAGGAPGQVVFAGDIGGGGEHWQGTIATLRLAPAQGPALQLEAPTTFAVAASRWQFARACFAVVDLGGRLCAAADGNRFDLDGEALPLALLQPWLPADTGVAMQAYGTLTLQARLRRDDGGHWSGTAQADSADGGLKLADDLAREVFGYRDLAVRLTLADDAVDGTLHARLAADGRVDAQLHTGLAADAGLAGELRLDVRDLTWLELFSEDIAAPVGTLAGTLQVAGTRAAPALSGNARLAGFAAELPGLGVKLRDGAFDVVGSADGTLRLAGQVQSGDGVLHLQGSLDADDPQAPLVLALKGEAVTLASTAELYAIADPDLTLRWLPDRLEVRGALVVPEARIDLEALDSSVATSPDVVVVDPVDAVQARGKPLDLQFAVTLGDEVRLKGFGLDGRIAGALTLSERPGHRATASGTLQVSGKYRAYGQALDITHARLGYADSPYDDPTLDIRAERRFDRVTVGVQVRGSARRPQTTVVSSPAMEASEALSWLVFGRPLRTTTSGESQQLSAAAVALGAGGNLVAQQLGARLGLDEAGVVESRNLGGAAFTVGKYVSPRLFLSYGVSLIGTGQVVTLKYLLTRDFDISVESGVESAASLNWRREK